MNTKRTILQFTFSLFIMSLLVSCSTGHRIEKDIDYSASWYVAWNEDSINSYKFLRLKYNGFAYTIEKSDSTKELDKKVFYGTYRETFDTIHLDFKNKPLNWESYLVCEVSGRYVVQKFSDFRKSVFMRIQRAPFR
jgi:hypothetical protein